MSIFSRKNNTLADVSSAIEKLQADRAAALARQEALLAEASESDQPDKFAAEYSKLDFVLSSLSRGIEKLEQQRSALELAERKKQYGLLKTQFQADVALFQKVGDAHRRQLARARLFEGAFPKLFQEIEHSLGGHKGRALELLKSLDLTEDQQAAERAALGFSATDYTVLHRSEFEQLYIEYVDDVLKELEALSGVKLPNFFVTGGISG